MKSAKVLCGLAAVWWGLALSQAVAQRVQFATPIAADATAPAAPAPAPSSLPPSAYGPAPGAPPPAAYSTPPPPSAYSTPAPPSAYPNPAAPPLGPSPAAPTSPGMNWGGPAAPPAPGPAAPLAPIPATPPGGAAPIYGPPPGTPAPPPAVPGGAIQPPPANWDPYAAPGGAPGTLLPQDPYLPPGSCGQFSMATMQKFIQHVDLDFDWFAGNGDHELGIDDVNLSVTFAFPMLFNSSTPLLVTPGFAVHYWSGPVSEPPAPPDFTPPADMPARTYDAYLDFAWNPWVNEFFGGELNFRTGIYSDFYSVTTQSLRFMGKGMAVLRFSPCMTVKAGVWYLDRVTTKILPAGGVCWTPNPDIYFDILFPNPKIGRRLTTWGNTEWWLYARGDYGGGVWTIRRNPDYYNGIVYPVLNNDLTEYDDIRIAVGVDFKTLRQMKGYFEVGFACDRQLNYKSGLPSSFYPNNTVFVGAGLSY